MTKAGAAYLWLVPVLAVLIGMARLLWFAYEDGPEITISFLDAEGLESGRTPVRFKDVEVGTVTAVTRRMTTSACWRRYDSPRQPPMSRSRTRASGSCGPV
ncbi:MlaD family protein [Ralstonia solanacearum]|uniref:MlaD family protein n=1 Tax=Ralstonia solanacearum TaxID=305 RepID=UPI002E208EDC